MDELLGELGGETDAKPLFSDEMQPPTDEDAEFLSMNRFLGKEFSAEPPPDLQDDSTEGKKNDGEWSDEEDLFTAPLHKDFSSLAEPAPDEMMDLEPSTNGTRGGRRESKTKADEAGTPESEMETFELTEASLSPDDNLETDLDDILGVPSNANSAEPRTHNLRQRPEHPWPNCGSDSSTSPTHRPPPTRPGERLRMTWSFNRGRSSLYDITARMPRESSSRS